MMSKFQTCSTPYGVAKGPEENLYLIERLMREKGFKVVEALSSSMTYKTFHSDCTLIEAGFNFGVLGYTVLEGNSEKEISSIDIYSKSRQDKPFLIPLGTNRQLLVFPGYQHDQSIYSTHFKNLSQLNKVLNDLANIKKRLMGESLKCSTKNINKLCRQLFLPEDGNIYIATNPQFDESRLQRGSLPIQIINSFKKS